LTCISLFPLTLPLPYTHDTPTLPPPYTAHIIPYTLFTAHPVLIGFMYSEEFPVTMALAGLFNVANGIITDPLFATCAAGLPLPPTSSATSKPMRVDTLADAALQALADPQCAGVQSIEEIFLLSHGCRPLPPGGGGDGDAGGGSDRDGEEERQQPATPPPQPAPSSSAGSTAGHAHVGVEDGERGATATREIGGWVEALCAKTPTPGGGGAAGVAAAVGDAAGAMACVYTSRKKDRASGAAELAAAVEAQLRESCGVQLAAADADMAAYAALQQTWKKDSGLSKEDTARIEATALAVPTDILERAHADAIRLATFVPDCNPNITSDAKVGVHILAGAARAAFQTVLVNSPPAEERRRLGVLLEELGAVEAELLANDE
jgi:formiminotetrahydrofolate cyclodeaminase